MLLLRLQGPLTFFVIAYLIVLVQSNLLHTYKCIVRPIIIMERQHRQNSE